MQGACDFSKAFAAEAIGQWIGFDGDEGLQQLDEGIELDVRDRMY